MNDDELLKALRSAVEHADPVPPDVIDVARRAHQWDTELALLAISFDSATADLATSGLRSDTAVRDVTFSADGIEFELTVASGQLDGRVTPPDTAVALVIPSEDPVVLAVDDVGRFNITTSASAGAFVLTVAGVRHRTELIDFDS